MCSLDAEKCFDNIWHDALFYKLSGAIPTSHWMFLYRWYTNLRVCVRWNGSTSNAFSVTRGMRQGSVLSPYFFNIFLDDLLTELASSDTGLRIGQSNYNSFAYADDVTLMSATVPGLHNMIDRCVLYASQWRMRFGLKKSKCMVFGRQHFDPTPSWLLGGQAMATVDCMEFLGVTFSSFGGDLAHVDNISRVRSFYSIGCAGLAFPGTSADVNTYLWKSACVPSLTYGLDLLDLSRASVNKLESTQGTLIKQAMGIGKRSHHTKLLAAMDIPPVQHIVDNMTLSLFNRIFKVDSPTRDLSLYLLGRYVTEGRTHKGTLVSQVVNMGVSPTRAALTHLRVQVERDSDGVVDSIQTLLSSQGGCSSWSKEHSVLKLLTKAF